MPHTLVTLLGRGRQGQTTGYRQARYRFPDDTIRETSLFGLALAEYLEPDEIVILGTRGSQWCGLVEHLAAGGEDQAARDRLMYAEDKEEVDQPLLDKLTGLMSRSVGRKVTPRLIPFGQDEDEQNGILLAISAAVSSGRVSVDLTHGFRHLGMIGFLSTFMLESSGNIQVRDLWYGALDMAHMADGVAPVLRLDGLVRVRRWLNALDRFDATGDYGVFAPLLIEDRVAEDKANCLKKAAFFERTSNVWDAKRQIETFLPVLEAPLSGAAGVFQQRLGERLKWTALADVAARQQELAYLYLQRGDYVRAAIFGVEACTTRACEETGGDPATADYDERKRAVEEFEEALSGDRERNDAYWKLKHLRNALAHGTLPNRRLRRWLQPILKDPDRLSRELEAAFAQLLLVRPALPRDE